MKATRVRTADQLRRTDAAAALQGGLWETESSQNTFTDGQGNKYWLIDTTGGAVSVALPAAADASPDTLFTVKRTTGGANALTVTPDSGNIDGSAAHSIATQYAAFAYASDGTNYHIVRQYNPGALGEGSVSISTMISTALGPYVTSNSLSAAVATDTLTVRGSGAISATASVGFVNLTGGQIKFPATHNASADGNTLDDYEEGTWTPAMTFNASSTGVTYSTQTGFYVKIGKMVYYHARVVLTSNGTGVGAARITGLPFTVSASDEWPTSTFKLGAGGSAATGIFGSATNNTTTIELLIPGAVTTPAATDTNCTDTFNFFATGIYRATA